MVCGDRNNTVTVGPWSVDRLLWDHGLGLLGVLCCFVVVVTVVVIILFYSTFELCVNRRGWGR